MRHQKKLLVIASFPPKGTTDHKAVVGGASYTKRALVGMLEAAKRKGTQVAITVLAERLNNEPTHSYRDQGMTVHRIWKRGSLSLYVLLLKYILSDKKSKHVVIGFELSMFGEKLSLLPFLPFLFLVRLFGKRVTIVFHQVILDISELYGHMNIPKEGIKTTLLGIFLRAFYKCACFVASDTIVFEETFRKRLAALGNKKPVAVIPLPVEKKASKVSKSEARNRLSLPQKKFILLSFGFLAWYKGTDWLVHEIQKAKKEERRDILLVLAGGPNPNHANKPFYQTYIKDITAICKKEGITLTGFVAEKDMPLYFQAADIVLFPYRSFMSSSAPLALAFTHQKPFLLSKPMVEMLHMPDMTHALKKSQLTEESVFLSHATPLVRRIQDLRKDKKTLQKMQVLSRTMKNARTWSVVGNKYYNTLSTYL